MDAQRQRGHWDAVYENRPVTELSWYQREPRISSELIRATGIGLDAAIIDVGGGSSALVDSLLSDGYTDVTVLDIAPAALVAARGRLAPEDRELVRWLEQDILSWRPDRKYSVWHDRAVFHFLVDQAARAKYAETLDVALADDGFLVIGTFALDGPETCSGLPVMRYDATHLLKEFGDLELVEERREEHLTPGGALQPFAWMVARRSR